MKMKKELLALVESTEELLREMPARDMRHKVIKQQIAMNLAAIAELIKYQES